MLGCKQKKLSTVYMTSPPLSKGRGGPNAIVDKAAWWERRIHGFDPWSGRCRFMLGYTQQILCTVYMTSPPWGKGRGGPNGVVDKAVWWERRRHGFDPWWGRCTIKKRYCVQ